MPNLRLKKRSNFRMLTGLLISVALAPAIYSQGPRQLQVEVGPNQQVRILASDVSYGEILRALQRKLGWEIEIPSLADELKLPYVRVEASQPQIAFAKLLQGSRLGYAFLGAVNGSRSMKVIVIPSAPPEARLTQDTTSSPPTPDNVIPRASLPFSSQAPAGTASQPNAATAETTPGLPPTPPTMPLSQAVSAIGAPPGVSPADVGKTVTMPLSEATNAIGAPPGVSPADVGKTITLPLPTGPGKRP